ncbi:bifunctional DNA primase/polymerase [Desulfosediminicola sp.]|uniref:bifunctional DNA primase/polymerase n=1 Tax=Desulfosediminicola sp. TaxID=2886825 RepID=UPI003AF2878C
MQKQEVWKHLADDMELTMMKLPPRSKKPAGKWGHLQYRPYADIGFQPDDNAAVITSDIIVLDVDDIELFEQAAIGEVPETLTVKTSKGFHYYYGRPDGDSYRLRSRKPFGFDIRADVGYVVAPGSVHPDGSLYEIVKNVPMVTAPDWLADLSRGGNNTPCCKVYTIKELPDVDLSRLDLTTKRTILTSVPEGGRSEAIHWVMHRMVDNRYNYAEIVSVFLSNPIGEKALEKDNPESWLLGELERALDSKEERTIRVPDADELSSQYKELADEGCTELVHMLHDYGNQISEGQKRVLASLMLLYAGLAQGLLAGRIAAPLPTGFGKTTSIVALLKTAEKKKMLGNNGFTVAVAAARVQQTIDIYEELLKAGVAKELISMIHHDENATHPATIGQDGAFITDRPILLATHNKVIGQKINEQLTERTFIIWDESLISTNAKYFNMKDLNLGVAAFRDASKQHGVRPETVRFVEDCVASIEKNIAEQKETGEKSVLRLPIWEADIALEDIKRVIQKERHLAYKTAMETLVAMVEVTDHDMSVHIANNTELVISYEVVVPDELQNVVVLDASAEINELMKLDESIYKPENFPEIPVTYLDTVVHRIDHKAGRAATEKALNGEKLKSAILEIIRKHPSESILLFTYKHRNGELNHRQAIEEYLTENGIDIQEQLDGRNRFNWLTHGNETASNKYAHCTVALFVGVLFQNDGAYISKTIGQLRDHSSTLNAGEVTKVLRGLQAQAVHQGMNRCASRRIKNDKAGAVNVYYTYPNESLSGHLNHVLPDADFRLYNSDVLQPRTMKGKVQKRIVDKLATLPDNISKISSKALSSLVPELATMSKSHRRRVMSELIADPSIPWMSSGRSLIKAGAQ